MESEGSTTSAARRAGVAALGGDGARTQALALAAVLGLGLLLRLSDIGRPFYGYYMWNEAYYATITRNFDHFGLLNAYNYDWRGGSELGLRLGPSPFVPWLVYLSTHLLGPSEAAARLPILILGMLSLVALYLVARELYGARVALVATFAAAIMPGAVFLSRQVALDSPMTAFGLASVWTLLRARREPRGRWLMAAASSLCLGIAVFIKYTGVLFAPVLAWIWVTILWPDRRARSWLRWSLPVAYFLVAALPAFAWLVRGWLASRGATLGGGAGADYLLRAHEWEPRNWLRAGYATWVRLGQQVGHVLWYPLAIAAVLWATPRGILRFVREHVEVLLLILPWFAQLIYPISWYRNDGYTYPVLYGVAILVALAVRHAVRLLQAPLRPSREQVRVRAGMLATLALVACLSDYRQFYWSWYKDKDFTSNLALQQPANLIDQDDPFAPARKVRALNTSHAPVLADSPATLYYAQDQDWQGRATWFWWAFPDERERLPKAIESLEYAYVVFTYQPPSMVVNTLAKVGYEPVGPGVWRRPPAP